MDARQRRYGKGSTPEQRKRWNAELPKKRAERARRAEREAAEGAKRRKTATGSETYPVHPDAIECRACGRLYNALEKHLHAEHGYGVAEYRRRYPCASTHSETLRLHYRATALDREVGRGRSAYSSSGGDRTPAELIAELRRDAGHLRRPPKASDWEKPEGTRPSYHVIERVFGTWNAGLEAAGLLHRKPGKPRRWTREKIIATLLADTAARGRPPTWHEWRKPKRGRPTAQTVARLFGSWNAALAAAGLPTRKRGGTREKVAREKVIAALRREASRLGRPPSARKWTRERRRPGYGTIVLLFGSWNGALTAAGLSTRQPAISSR